MKRLLIAKNILLTLEDALGEIFFRDVNVEFDMIKQITGFGILFQHIAEDHFFPEQAFANWTSLPPNSCPGHVDDRDVGG